MLTLFAAYMLTSALLAVVVSGEFKTADRYGNYCPALLQAEGALNSAPQTFIYRCRHGDDCGGVGDRLGGAMAAAYFSLVSDRSFRIHWPGIEHVFKPGHSNWTFDPVALDIPYYDANGNELDKTRNHQVVGRGRIQAALPGVADIAMFNDLNCREISKESKWGFLRQFKHIYFHSNRSPDLVMHTFVAQKLRAAEATNSSSLPDGNAGHKDAYRCMFNDIFQPTDEFLNSTYKAIDHEPMPFIDLINMVNRVDERSLAFHFRIDDKHVAEDSEAGRIDNTTMHWLASLGTKHQVKHSKLNLFFITNSPASAKKVLHDGSIRAAFGRVFCQELTGSRHTNSEGAVLVAPPKQHFASSSSHAQQQHFAQAQGHPHTVHAGSSMAMSFQQAMRDWWLMRIADILVCGYSGFCISAGVVASEKQVKYDGILKQIEIPKEELCTNRDCAR